MNAVKNLGGDEEFVGSVFESNADHIARHRGTPHELMCPRCHYIRNKTDIQRWAPWAAPRPRHMGGAWRLGCDVCTWALGNRTAREKHASRRGNDIRASTFARQNFTCNTRYCDFELKLRAHAQCQYHRVASSAANRLAGQFPRRMLRETEPHVAPGGKEASVRPMAQETAEGNDEACFDENSLQEAMSLASADVGADKSLLKGKVPQITDWINAWAEATEHVSFRKQVRIWGKKNGRKIHDYRRKVRRNQLKVIAETRREDVRKHLRRATCISLALDERKYKKIVRFRCDAPKRPFFFRGILGVHTCEKSAVGDFEEDHALIAVRTVDRFLNRFCTPLGGTIDMELKEHIRKSVRTFAADGASKERRALLLATKDVFPNVLLLLRDGAHALRIAIKDPLRFDELFGDVWQTVFNKRHALVPDLMNSKKWQDHFKHIQRAVLKIPFEKTPLKVVLEHLRFAKQRFDSTADPIAKVAFMLLPLATMLAYVGSDERLSVSQRVRAKDLLKKLDSKFSLAIAVSADWGLVTQAFIRLFDKDEHDIAQSKMHIDCFTWVLDTLFEKGAVFSSRGIGRKVDHSNLPAVGGYMMKTGVRPMFVTEWIEDMLRRRVVFNCGGEQVMIWGTPDAADVKEIVERMKCVTRQAIERIVVEFEHLEVFSCFDVSAARKAYSSDDDDAKRKQQELHRHVRKLAVDLSVDHLQAVLNYRTIVPILLDLTTSGKPLFKKSNSQRWGAMLDIIERRHPEFRALPPIIRWYVSIEDGECGVERDLGVLTKADTAHTNAKIELSEDVLLARDDNTQRHEITIGGLADGSCGRLGPKGKRWAATWRAVYGARGCYQKHVKPNGAKKRGHKIGTFAAAKAGVLAAAECALSAEYLEDPTSTSAAGDTSETGGESLIPLGIRKSVLTRPLDRETEAAYRTPATAKFAKLTKAKKIKAQPFLNRFAAKVWVRIRAAKPAEPLTAIRAVAFFGDVGARLPHGVVDDGLERRTEAVGRDRCLLADLVVVDDLGRLGDCTGETDVCHMLAVVARGLPVVTAAAWKLARGDPDRIPAESVIRHRPLAMEQKVKFEVDVHFRARSGNVVRMLTALCKLRGSKWRIADASSPGVAVEKGCEVVKITEVRAIRSWVKASRRIRNALGAKAWSLSGESLV